jgi:hypothetical protein
LSRNFFRRGTIVFNDDGTFGKNAGKWVQLNGMVIFRFADTLATYSGNVVGNIMVGIMTDWVAGVGCWYAIRTKIKTFKVKDWKPEFDVTGKKLR